MSAIPTPKPRPSKQVYHIQRFVNDIVYKRLGSHKRTINKKPSTNDQAKESTRGEIKSFSKKSKHRLLHNIRNTQHQFKQFITLTYPKEFPKDGRIVKAHLNKLLTRIRQEFKGAHYCWVFEAQSRGAAHFHILLNIELPNESKSDKNGEYYFSEVWSKRWSKITGNQDNKKHIRYGLRIDPVSDNNTKKLASYMAKYYAKNEQKVFKHDFTGIGRYWGASRGFTVPVSQGIYQADEMKWMLKLCFHYANLERMRAGYRRYSYSVDRGCSIWNFKEIFDTKIEPQFRERLNSPYQDLEKPLIIYDPDISGSNQGEGI